MSDRIGGTATIKSVNGRFPFDDTVASIADERKLGSGQPSPMPLKLPCIFKGSSQVEQIRPVLGVSCQATKVTFDNVQLVQDRFDRLNVCSAIT